MNPVRFLLFVLVGCLGVLVHLCVLGLLHHAIGLPFGAAQASATLTAMIGNFFVNNALTYRDQRLHGTALWWGLSTFCLACAIGAIMNFALADFLFGRGLPWALAGLGGAFAGSVWNYATTATVTWPQRAAAAVLPALDTPSDPPRDRLV